MQVLLAAMLINAFHAAFENRVVALNRIRIDFSVSLALGKAILADRVAYGAVAREIAR